MVPGKLVSYRIMGRRKERMKTEHVFVNNLEEMAGFVNHNSDVMVKSIEKLEKQITILAKSNRGLAFAGLFLAGALYLANKKITNLELKVKNLETVNNFMKGEDKDEDTLK